MEKLYWKPYPKDPDMLFRKGFPHNPITCGWDFSTINPTRSGGTCSLRVKEVWLRTVFLVSRGKILVRFVWQGPKQDPLWIYCGLINIMGRSPPFCKSFSCGGRGKENNWFKIKKPIYLPQFYWVPHLDSCNMSRKRPTQSMPCWDSLLLSHREAFGHSRFADYSDDGGGNAKWFWLFGNVRPGT